MVEESARDRDTSFHLHSLLHANATDIKIGSSIWVPDDASVWKVAEVTEVVGEGNDSVYRIEIDADGTKVAKSFRHTQVIFVDPSHLVDMDNLCLMNNMHEAPLLDLLRRRFVSHKIYTYTSDILISLNPFETIPGLYESPGIYYHLDDSSSGYMGEADEEQSEALAPHVYQIANNALKSLCNARQEGEFANQSVIISGESGAGKTENSKYVLGYLIEANNILSSSTTNAEETSFAEYLKEVLVQSSVVLEAFGNAKTLRNDNSSRFGKYIKLLYESETSHVDGRPYPRLVSALTETFLLEKSRLTSVGKGERSYHIFYQLVSALNDASVREELGLHHSAEEFRVLAQGDCCINSHDVSDYDDTIKALTRLQVSPEEIKQIIQILAIILHLGNLQFQMVDEESERVELSCPTIPMENLSNMMGLHPATLRLALTTQTMQVRGRASIRTKILSLDDVSNNSNALLKWLYSNLFDWIVRKINFCHSSKHESTAESHFIGILDIFGFEILKTNSFEQLCINYTNERLQQQFNQHVFISEQEMYRSEGLEWKNISFKDNQPVIDLISSTKKPLGLLQLLEEQGMLNRKPDDLLVLGAFNQQHEVKGKDASNILYSKSKFGNNGFVIRHFAGDVSYLIDGFLVKNNDSLQEDLMNTMRLTSNKFMRHIMGYVKPGENIEDMVGEAGFIPAPTPSSSASALKSSTKSLPVPAPTPAGPGGKKMASSSSVSLQFRVQLDVLMNTLFSTTPHYIKCIKSNTLKQGGIFEPPIIIQQLRYSGVLEVVRIRREGFPVRMTFKDFVLKYRILLRALRGRLQSQDIAVLSDADARSLCETMIQMADVSHCVQVGHSLIFLRDQAVNVMHMAIDRFYGLRAVKIQSRFRAHRQSERYRLLRNCSNKLKSFFLMLPHRMRFKRIVKSTIFIQVFMLSRLQRRKFLYNFRRKSSATVIQKYYRRHRLMQTYLRLRLAVVAVQTHVRRFVHKSKFQKIVRSVIRLQAWARSVICSRRFSSIQMCAIFIQTIVRQHLARRRFQLLKVAAVAIQSILRMTCMRRKFVVQRQKVLQIQSLIRGIICRRRVRKAVSAIRIQAQLRRFLARKKYVRLRSAILLQSWLRRFISRHRYEKLMIATLAVQTTLRKFLRRKRFLATKARVIRVQSLVRRFLAIHHFMQQYVVIIRLQSFVRMMSCMRRFDLQRASIAVLQTWFRTMPLRHKYLIQRYAAISIQTSVRRFLAMESYGRSQFAALKIQTLARTYICMARLRMYYASIIALQAFIRKSLAQRRYMLTYASTLLLQAVVRGYLARNRYLFVRFTVIFIQKIVRGFLARKNRKEAMTAIVTLQSFGRMINARYAYDEALISVITIQAFVRCRLNQFAYQHFRAYVVMAQTYVRQWLAMLHFGRDYRRIITLQAFGRRIIERSRYQETLFYIIFVQSIVRRFVYRMRYRRARKMTLRLQAWFRAQPPRWKLAAYCRAVTLIAKHYRRWIEHARFSILRYAVWRTQRATRSFLQNITLKRHMRKIHDIPEASFASVPVAKATIQQLIGALRSHPMDRYVRYFEFDYRSLLHSMILFSDNAAVSELLIEAEQQLGFSSGAVVEMDLFGRSTAHYLGMQPSLFQAQHMARVLDTFVDPAAGTVDVMEGLDEDDDDQGGDQGGGGESSRVNQIRQAVNESVNKSKLREGWLKKKRGGMLWQKRWMVLTEDYMIYYKTNTTLNNPKFAIPLDGCTVQRVPGSREPCFEIFAPNMGVKKSLFGSSTKKSVVFMAENEKEMQEWLTPLRAVAGVDTLRSSPVTYVRMELRVLWLTQPDHEGESALHSLVHSNASLRMRLMNLPIQSDESLLYYRNKVEESVKLIAWFVENGCPVNIQNIHGDTALHIALTEEADPLVVRALITRGANPRNLRNNDNLTCFDILNNNAAIHKTFAEEFARAVNVPQRSNVLGFENKMKGYSYLSIYFGSQLFERSMASIGDQPLLLVSACNSQGELVESGKEVRGPAFVQSTQDNAASVSKQIYWGASWHMRTPVENLEPGSYVFVQYKSRIDGPVVSLGQFPIERETIDSTEVTISMLAAPDASGRQPNPILMQNEKASLTADITLTRKPRIVPFETLYVSG